jgi:hypothetical protein
MTALPHRDGGAWTVTSSGTLVSFVGNVGGLWKVPVGAVLRFSPPVDGIAPTATVTQAIEGGSEAGGLARALVLYDDFDQAPDWEMFRAEAANGPVAVVAWLRSLPVEGRSGFSAGQARQGRERRMFFREWQVLCVSTSSSSFRDRWSRGMALHEAVAMLLEGRKRNDDGEYLTTGPKGLEVMEQSRVAPDNTTFSAFRVSLRTISGRSKLDDRAFPPWLWSRISGYFPAEPDADPAHASDLPLYDTVEPMPQDDAVLAALAAGGMTEPELRAALGWATPRAITPHLEGMAARGLVVEASGTWSLAG